MTNSTPVPVAVFASGGGSNLQALLDFESRTGAYRVVLVVTDRECGAEKRAEAAGRPVARIPVSGRPAEDVAKDTLDAFNDPSVGGVDLVCLAGYTRLIPDAVTSVFTDRMLNVHPALLPAFGGKGMYGSRVHEAVVAAGVSFSGPTIHLVNEKYDEGRILAQWPVPVFPDDEPSDVAARVLAAEHLLYPVTVEAVANAIAAETPLPRFLWRSDRHEPLLPQVLQQRMREAFTSNE